MDRSPNLLPSCSGMLPSMFPSLRLAFFLAFSALAFCADYQIEANIRYGTFPENVLDIVQSPAPALKNRPGVIVIHGAGDKSSVMDKFCVPARHLFRLSGQRQIAILIPPNDEAPVLRRRRQFQRLQRHATGQRNQPGSR